jgi:hypothetical protein
VILPEADTIALVHAVEIPLQVPRVFRAGIAIAVADDDHKPS